MMLEHLDKLAETSAKAISNIKFDKIVVWENGGANGRSNTADFLHKMAGTLPPMMQVMRDIGGVEIPESLAKLAGEETAATAGNGRAPDAERRGQRNGRRGGFDLAEAQMRLLGVVLAAPGDDFVDRHCSLVDGTAGGDLADGFPAR